LEYLWPLQTGTTENILTFGIFIATASRKTTAVHIATLNVNKYSSMTLDVFGIRFIYLSKIF
jgi:hypothetical protein